MKLNEDETLSLLITLGLVAAGVLVAALLVDLTIRRYAILAPAAKPDLKVVTPEEHNG